MFQRFLLAIDASPSGEVAVDFATALAKRCGSSVHVLHVNEYLVGGRGIPLLTREESTLLLERAVNQLRDAGVTATGSSPVAPYRQVPALIAEGARHQGADAIILGSSRRGRIARLFSARVRTHTMRLSELPVLSAPSPLDVRPIDEAASRLVNRWDHVVEPQSHV
jgi:nucleotide-binding universal stress UspA family protein